jgi:hypothetical protein
MVTSGASESVGWDDREPPPGVLVEPKRVRAATPLWAPLGLALFAAFTCAGLAMGERPSSPAAVIPSVANARGADLGAVGLGRPSSAPERDSSVVVADVDRDHARLTVALSGRASSTVRNVAVSVRIGGWSSGQSTLCLVGARAASVALHSRQPDVECRWSAEVALPAGRSIGPDDVALVDVRSGGPNGAVAVVLVVPLGDGRRRA